MNRKLLINEVAKLLGIEPSAIRYWEKKGLLHLPRDEESDYRYFDNRALQEVLDIVFFRKLQLSIKDLTTHLTGTITERKSILENRRKEIQEAMETLQQAEVAIQFRLNRLQEIEKLQIDSEFLPSHEMDFIEVERLELLRQEHMQQYLTDPSHFVLFFEGNPPALIKEGVIIHSAATHEKVLWKKEASTQIIFGGLLEVDIEDYQKNTLYELRQEHSVDPEFNQVIAQYLSSGKRNNQPVDYYKCWFIKS